MTGPVLETRNLTVRFGGLTAVNDVSIRVRPGEIFSIIGPNGAGKTTVFNAISGIHPPTEGVVLFRGQQVQRAMTARVAAAIALVGLATGLGLLTLVSIQEIWQIAVIDNFRDPAKGFPWGEAVAEVFGHWARSPAASLLTFLLGAAIGAGAMYVGWRRTRRTPDVISRLGIGRTFQNIRLFQEMSVIENVLVSLETGVRTPIWKMILRLPSVRRTEAAMARKAAEILEFVGLAGRANEIAKNLPYGDQRRLELARALGLQPALLLVDEPAAGMNPAETAALMELIRRVRDRGTTVLVIEHHMRLVMGISDRIAVLDYGNKIAEGPPERIRTDPKVIEAYLGKEEVE